MTTFVPTLNTTIFLIAFMVIYGAVLLRRAARTSLDVVDFLMLSTVGVVPALYVFFPNTVVRLAKLVGVEFSFLLLFGALFLVAFVLLYQLIVRINHQNARIVLLVQEIGMLRREVEELRERGEEASERT